jgi:hypothetical protein
METFEGPEVERLRIDKIEDIVTNLDSGDAKLDWIYLHFFQSYATVSAEWFFDETVSIVSRFPKMKSPIPIDLMVVHDDGDIEKDVYHWQKTIPK